MKLSEKIEKLEEYASAANSEHGDYLNLLTSLYHRQHDMGTSFKDAWEAEINEMFEYYKWNYRIVEEEETVTHKVTKLTPFLKERT